jgi:chromosome segregation ATPase
VHAAAVEAHEAAVTHLKLQTSGAREELVEAVAKRDELFTKVKALKVAAAGHAAHVVQLREAGASSEAAGLAEAETARAELNVANAARGQLKRALEGAKAAKVEAVGEAESLQTKLSASEAEQQRVETERGAAVSKANALQRKMRSAAAVVEALRAEVAALTETHSQKMEDHAKAHTALKLKARKLNEKHKLSSKNAAAHEENALKMRRKAKQLLKAKKVLEESVQEHHETHERLHGEKTKLAAQLEEAEQEHIATRDELAHHHATVRPASEATVLRAVQWAVGDPLGSFDDVVGAKRRLAAVQKKKAKSKEFVDDEALEEQILAATGKGATISSGSSSSE